MKKYVGELLKRQFHKLQPLSTKQKRAFLVNLFVGIMISVGFHFIETTNWGERQTAWQMDTFDVFQSSKLHSSFDNGLEHSELVSDKLMFVEITHDQYVKSNRPTITSRKIIANAIDKIASANAAVVLVDILLDEKNTSSDDRYLETMITKLKQNSSTRLILPLNKSVDGTFGTNHFVDTVDNQTVYLGRPTIGKSNFDGIVRYWRPYDVGIDPGSGQKTLYWNTALLAVAILHNKQEQFGEVSQELLAGTEKQSPEMAFSERSKIFLSMDDISSSSNRIRFLLRPNQYDWKNGKIRAGTIPVMMNITIDELNDITDKALLEKIFKGKIVVLGNSSPDLGDYYLTPIGSMAGMYVQGNTINMLEKGLLISRKAKAEPLALEILLIIVSGYLFVIFPPNVAKLMLTFGLSLTMVLAFYYLQIAGVFVNVILPLLGISIHNLVSTLEHLLGQKH